MDLQVSCTTTSTTIGKPYTYILYGIVLQLCTCGYVYMYNRCIHLQVPTFKRDTVMHYIYVHVLVLSYVYMCVSLYMCMYMYNMHVYVHVLYISLHSLAMDEASISALGLDGVEHAWVDTMIRFRLLALNSAGTRVNISTSIDMFTVCVPYGIPTDGYMYNAYVCVHAHLHIHMY